MIQLQNVTKFYRTKVGRHVVLDSVSFTFERGRSIGILGLNGAGKSTLIRLLAGLEYPNRGRVKRRGRISWPLAFSGGFNGPLTGAENARFVARIYDVEYDGLMDYVADFSELGAYMDMPVNTYSTGMRARLAFALSLAMDFDMYLIDEITAVGDARFRDRCKAALTEKRQYSDVVMVSHSIGMIREYCDAAVILEDGRLETFGSLGDTIAEYERRAAL